MLKSLTLQNIAIAKNVEVCFSKGLNVITGETGAGKSLFVDALNILLGNRFDIGMIRTGTTQAQVCGVFVLPPSSAVYATLEEFQLQNEEDPQEIILRRVLLSSGKSKAFINDIPVKMKVLQDIAEELIDISSQFENQRLLKSDSHTYFLDEFIGASTVAQEVKQAFLEISHLFSEIEKLENEKKYMEREKNRFEHEYQEIVEADLKESEFNEIQEMVNIGKKTDSVQALCSEMVHELSDSSHSCQQSLRQSRRVMERLMRFMEGADLQISFEPLDGALAYVESILDDLVKIQRYYEVDSGKLKAALERMEIYNKLLSKHGNTLEKVFEHQKLCEEFLSRNVHIDDDIHKKIEKSKELLRYLEGRAKLLSEERHEKKGALDQKIEKVLEDLGMKNATFKTELALLQRSYVEIPSLVAQKIPDELLLPFFRMGRTGFETARFLLSANSGMAPQPLEKVASGGELSRIMLAIKSILFASDSMSLFVFDEIDTGISGSIAAKVGRKMKEFASSRQAICITHLPQVACYSDFHFIVRKEVSQNETYSVVTQANEKQKREEIAKLICGEEVTQEALQQAQSLMEESLRS